MRIDTRESDLTILGNIGAMESSMEIKDAAEDLLFRTKAEALNINIADSCTISSTLIGFLLKIALVDRIRVSVNVGNESLFRLMEDLELTNVLNVKINSDVQQDLLSRGTL